MEEEEASLLPKVKFSAKEMYGVDVPTYKIESIYLQDFKGERARRPDLICHEQDFNDPLAGPYLDPLLPETLISKQKDPSKYNKAEDLYNKFASKYPNIKKKVFPEKVDESKISKDYEDDGKTVYQVEFCKSDKSKKEKEKPQFSFRKIDSVKLPEDWVPPLSTQRASYRDIFRMKDEGLLSFEVGAKPFKPPPMQLGFTSEEHEILQTTTGETEYQESLGISARDIMKEAFYGEVKPLPREFRAPVGDKPKEK